MHAYRTWKQQSDSQAPFGILLRKPYRKNDIDKLKRIHRRTTKMIPELRDLSYESVLFKCG